MPRRAGPTVALTSDQRALAAKWVPLAFRLARNRAAADPHLDADDLAGAAMVALLNAARLWRPDGGAGFATYAWHSIGRGLDGEYCRQRAGGLKGLANAVRNGRRGRDWPQFLGAIDPAGREADPAEEAAAKERVAQIRRAVNGLPDRQRLAIRERFFRGRGLSDVGETLGVSRPRAAELVEAGLERLRRALAA